MSQARESPAARLVTRRFSVTDSYVRNGPRRGSSTAAPVASTASGVVLSASAGRGRTFWVSAAEPCDHSPQGPPFQVTHRPVVRQPSRRPHARHRRGRLGGGRRRLSSSTPGAQPGWLVARSNGSSRQPSSPSSSPELHRGAPPGAHHLPRGVHRRADFVGRSARNRRWAPVQLCVGIGHDAQPSWISASEGGSPGDGWRRRSGRGAGSCSGS